MATFYLSHSAELYHHGVLGMHGGIRRYQPYSKGYKGDGKFIGKVRQIAKTEIKNPANPKGITMKQAKERRLTMLGGELTTKILVDKYGDRGATRIARRMMNGDSIDKALKKEKVRSGMVTALSIAASVSLSLFVISPLAQMAARSIVREHGSTALATLLSKSASAIGGSSKNSVITKAALGPSLSALFRATAALTPGAKKGTDIVRTIDSLLPSDEMIRDYYPELLDTT